MFFKLAAVHFSFPPSPSLQQEIPLDASVTSYGLQNLIPSSRYQVQVQALRRGIPTAPTSTSFTTGKAPPGFGVSLRGIFIRETWTCL